MLKYHGHNTDDTLDGEGISNSADDNNDDNNTQNNARTIKTLILNVIKMINGHNFGDKYIQKKHILFRW